MLALNIALRWMHIFSAITLMGGAIFMRWAYLPATEQLADEARAQLYADLRARWARLVMISTGFLLLSGVVNMVLIPMQYLVPGYYNALLGIKFLLALPVFYLAAVLSGRSKTAERFRGRLKMWLTINLLLAVLVVCLGGILRYVEREPKGEQAPNPTLQADAQPASSRIR